MFIKKNIHKKINFYNRDRVKQKNVQMINVFINILQFIAMAAIYLNKKT